MSERHTPETDAETMKDEYDHVDSDIGPFAPLNTVCADFARKLERERDEAIDKYQSLQKTFEEWQLKFLSGQAELLHNKDVERDKLFDEAYQIRIERDEAIRQRNETNESSVFSCNFYYEEKLKAERERDEIQEKYDNLATEHMLAVNKLCEERDEARKQIDDYRERNDLLPISWEL